MSNIELNQGKDGNGRTFGYDLGRKNFITWDVAKGKLIVALVENDTEEDRHGSIAATMRDASRIAARENRKEYSQFIFNCRIASK